MTKIKSSMDIEGVHRILKNIVNEHQVFGAIRQSELNRFFPNDVLEDPFNAEFIDLYLKDKGIKIVKDSPKEEAPAEDLEISDKPSAVVKSTRREPKKCAEQTCTDPETITYPLNESKPLPIHVKSPAIAPIVLLPGDPDRATWIAHHFFENPVKTTSYRHMFGYNGFYHGHFVSVQTTGMGGPSAAIVCEELYSLGAKAFIRVGTCGAIDDTIQSGDLMLVTAACTTDGTSKELFASHLGNASQLRGFSPTSYFPFLVKAARIADDNNIRYHAGCVASLDRFYGHSREAYHKLATAGISAVEMEAATILTFAATHGMKAAALMTVSDQVFAEKRASDDIIEQGVNRMIRVALEAGINTLN